MADDEDSQRRAQTEQDEARLAVGMIGVVEEQRIVVREDALCFVERNAMLAPIRVAFLGVPFESELRHPDIVHTS
ncbi:MAG TPA: hypothetical protein VH062_17830 [Polyangiaceae bacterium]|nr:hypothetical protein [Polyangiaceae bacterium]